MSEWEFLDYASKDNLLRTVREQSDQMLVLASSADTWQAPTAAGHWEVRDVVGHLVDTTEGYFVAFDAARTGTAVPDPLGVRTMNEHVDRGARAFRDASQHELLVRLEKDRQEMLAIIDELDAESWGGFMVPHKYMGPLPSCFYPVAQLVDYTCTAGTFARASGTRTRWTATRPTCSSRSASSCGSRPPSVPASSRSRSVCGSPATTAARSARQ
jgi:mycothiol maleylpyruvate isomerase-like protein